MAQTDSSAGTSSNFKNYNSVLQISVGKNLPFGVYSKRNIPFKEGYAINERGISFYLLHSHKVRGNLSFAGGISFIRNRFSSREFEKSYTQKFGDKIECSDFLYEHLSFYGGVEYAFISTPRISLSGYMGFGAMHTFTPTNDKVSLSVGKVVAVTYYEGGFMEVGGGFKKQFIASIDLRYNTGRELFFLASASFVQSQINYKVVETDNVTNTDSDFITTPLPITNLSFSVGVGTFF